MSRWIRRKQAAFALDTVASVCLNGGMETTTNPTTTNPAPEVWILFVASEDTAESVGSVWSTREAAVAAMAQAAAELVEMEMVELPDAGWDTPDTIQRAFTPADMPGYGPTEWIRIERHEVGL